VSGCGTLGLCIRTQELNLSEQNQSLDGDVTRLLSELKNSPDLMDHILPLIYDDLRQVARCQQARLGASPTLQTTELVHEAFIKLRQASDQPIHNRLHLKRLSYLAIRQLIVDHARGKLAVKRGAGQAVQTLEDHLIPGEGSGEEEAVLMVNDALERLEQSNPELAEVVIARFFGGYTAEEIGEMLDISVRTVQRYWERARAWLLMDMQDQQGDS
jgi:RNA polymerase sigma factor (TIGR02999 family)